MQCPDMINAASAWPVPILALVKESLCFSEISYPVVDDLGINLVYYA